MANIQELKHVEVGSAATFRKNINDDVDLIKELWTGAYMGSNQQEANERLSIGGLWIVTDEETTDD